MIYDIFQTMLTLKNKLIPKNRKHEQKWNLLTQLYISFNKIQQHFQCLLEKKARRNESCNFLRIDCQQLSG